MRLNPPEAAAGRALVRQMLAWAQTGQNAPLRLLPEPAHFMQWAHYPPTDAVDEKSGWRYYYHAHPPAERMAGEHGHFHVFVPAPRARVGARAGASGLGVSHLIGISVDAKGAPLRLFTTNRWVTDETWQPAEDICRFIGRHGLRHAAPHDVSRWLETLIFLYRAEIAALLRARDARATHRLNDRRLRIPSQRRINLSARLRLL